MLVRAIAAAWLVLAMAGATQAQGVARPPDPRDQVVRQTTVAQFLAVCRTDQDRCTDLAWRAHSQVAEEDIASMLNDHKPGKYCFPVADEDSMRRTMVGWLGAHAEVANGSLMDGVRAAHLALWPRQGECHRQDIR